MNTLLFKICSIRTGGCSASGDCTYVTRDDVILQAAFLGLVNACLPPSADAMRTCWTTGGACVPNESGNMSSNSSATLMASDTDALPPAAAPAPAAAPTPGLACSLRAADYGNCVLGDGLDCFLLAYCSQRNWTLPSCSQLQTPGACGSASWCSWQTLSLPWEPTAGDQEGNQLQSWINSTLTANERFQWQSSAASGDRLLNFIEPEVASRLLSMGAPTLVCSALSSVILEAAGQTSSYACDHSELCSSSSAALSLLQHALQALLPTVMVANTPCSACKALLYGAENNTVAVVAKAMLATLDSLSFAGNETTAPALEQACSSLLQGVLQAAAQPGMPAEGLLVLLCSQADAVLGLAAGLDLDANALCSLVGLQGDCPAQLSDARDAINAAAAEGGQAAQDMCRSLAQAVLSFLEPTAAVAPDPAPSLTPASGPASGPIGTFISPLTAGYCFIDWQLFDKQCFANANPNMCAAHSGDCTWKTSCAEWTACPSGDLHCQRANAICKPLVRGMNSSTAPPRAPDVCAQLGICTAGGSSTAATICQDCQDTMAQLYDRLQMLNLSDSVQPELLATAYLQCTETLQSIGAAVESCQAAAALLPPMIDNPAYACAALAPAVPNICSQQGEPTLNSTVPMNCSECEGMLSIYLDLSHAGLVNGSQQAETASLCFQARKQGCQNNNLVCSLPTLVVVLLATAYRHRWLVALCSWPNASTGRWDVPPQATTAARRWQLILICASRLESWAYSFRPASALPHKCAVGARESRVHRVRV